MLKNSKKHLFIFGLLTIVTTFSIGFSSWVSAEKTVQRSINSEMGDIYDSCNLFSFGTLKTFTFSKYGILKDETYQAKGEVYLQFKVKSKDGLMKYYGGISSFKIGFTMSSTNSSINLNQYLSKDQNEQLNYYVSYNSYLDVTSATEPNGSIPYSVDSRNVTSEITYTDNLEDFKNSEYIYFVLEYHYDFTSVFETFETSVFNPLNSDSDNGITFDFVIGMIE